MEAIVPPDNAPGAPSPGRVEKLLLRWLGKDAEISAVDVWSDRFRLIELQGDALREVAWTAGQKIQVALGGMRVARTYTPIAWDSVRGSTRFLVFLHGAAPGSDWARTAAPGAPCQIIGPRRSVDLGSGHAPIVLVGDETAFGLAAALRHAHPERQLTVLLEAGNPQECKPIIERLGLADALLVQRQADEAHLSAIQAHATAQAHTEAVFVLTGRASAIQHVQRALKQHGVRPSRWHAKAYWALGKTGLD